MTASEFQSKYGTPKVDVCVGVDPGVNSGVAVWSCHSKKFLILSTGKAVEAEHYIKTLWDDLRSQGKTLMVYVEDVRSLRLPKHLQNPGRTKGAGSVGRDVQRFLDFLEYNGIPHQAAKLSPKEFRSGDGAWFKAKTGYEGRTSEHARSAAGLVWGK